MIKVKFDYDTLVLSVTGHAQTAEKGQDLVCAAASILVLTLAKNLELLLPEYGTVSTEIEDGAALIAACIPDEEERDAVRTVFQTIVTGFLLLQEKAPEAVDVTVTFPD